MFALFYVFTVLQMGDASHPAVKLAAQLWKVSAAGRWNKYLTVF